MKYCLKPVDVLSFRDGRPFGSSGDHLVLLDFPPTPSTFYGAIRAGILSAGISNFADLSEIESTTKKITGTTHELGSLGIISPILFYHQKKGVLYPLPADVVKRKKSEFKEPMYLKPTVIPEGSYCNLPDPSLKVLSTGTDDFVESLGGYLTHAGIEQWTQGQAFADSVVLSTDEVFLTEARVGIGRENTTRTVKEGALFTVEFARIKEEISFLTDINTTIPIDYLKLGGEGRQCKVIPADKIEMEFGKIFASTGIKVLVLSPLYSKNGWRPESNLINRLESEYGLNLTLEAAAVGRPRSIGGWDLVKGEHKVMQRYVSPGTVYFFRSEKSDIEIAPKIIQAAVSEDELKQGYGFILTGGY